MDFLRRQLRFRDYHLGVFAIVVAGVYLVLVALALAYLLYYQFNPDPDAIGATFEGLPAIALTAPTSPLLLPATGPFDTFGRGAALLVLIHHNVCSRGAAHRRLRRVQEQLSEVRRSS